MVLTSTIDHHVSKTIKDFIADASKLFEAKVRETINVHVNQASQDHLTYPVCFDHKRMTELYIGFRSSYSDPGYSPHSLITRASYEEYKKLYGNNFRYPDFKNTSSFHQTYFGCRDVRDFIDFIKKCDKYNMPIVYFSYEIGIYPDITYYTKNHSCTIEYRPILTFITSNGLIIRRAHYIPTDNDTKSGLFNRKSRQISVNDGSIPGDAYHDFSDYFNIENIKIWSIEHAKYPRIPDGCFTKELIEGFRMGLVQQTFMTLNERESELDAKLAEIAQREEKLLKNIAAFQKIQDQFKTDFKDVIAP